MTTMTRSLIDKPRSLSLAPKWDVDFDTREPVSVALCQADVCDANGSETGWRGRSI
jgi:hypothetical protein